MRSIHKAKEKAAGQTDNPTAQIFASLLKSLEQGESFSISDLYLLSHDDFDLAVYVIKDWQLARYYMGKAGPLRWSLPSSD